MANILFVDIETSPKLAYVWRFFKENISPKQVREHGWLMSYAAVWNDSNEVIYSENRSEDDTEITRELIRLLDEADIVVGHNAQYFDCAYISGRALVLGLTPPSPYKVVDTCLSARKLFKFESNSLEYLSGALNLSNKKLTHGKFPGFELWKACLAGNEEAWTEMREYNIVDTLAVRELYYRMRPWIKNHPNIGVYTDAEEPVCSKCGGKHVHYRGYTYTNVGKFRKYVCLDCGGWSKTRFTENTKEKRKALLTNA